MRQKQKEFKFRCRIIKEYYQGIEAVEGRIQKFIITQTTVDMVWVVAMLQRQAVKNSRVNMVA